MISKFRKYIRRERGEKRKRGDQKMTDPLRFQKFGFIKINRRIAVLISATLKNLFIMEFMVE